MELRLACLIGAGLLALAIPGYAQPAAAVLNLYSARHYQTDERLYQDFTKATGIQIRRVDSDDAGILARLKSEGSSSPADVVLLVDAARLWRAEIDGLFAPVRSTALNQRVPVTLRGKDDGQGSRWFGISTRARVIVYDKSAFTGDQVARYEQLADPGLRGKVCTRSGSHPYNLSLFGSLIEHWGPAATEAWLKAVVGNMARSPKGGDTDQIRAVASGECGVALTNSYYLARLMRSTRPEDIATLARIGVVFPNQDSFGTHLNIAGAAVARHASNRDAAVRFLEYLVSDSAQRYFAEGNNEWPVVASITVQNAALNAFGKFKSESVPVSVVGMNQVKVQQMLDRVGYR